MISLNLLVLRAKNPKKLVSFYNSLGLAFKAERHGTGPKHHSCAIGGSTFEIYPLKSEDLSTSATRIGLSVESIEGVMEKIGRRGKVISPPKLTRWGYRAVVQDPEGHKVELVEREAFDLSCGFQDAQQSR